MPISGLLLTLAENGESRAAAIAAIEGQGTFTMGPVSGRWLPLAMEAESDRDSRTWHDWLMALPGVAFVDVVAVNFDADEPGNSERENAIENISSNERKA